MFSNAEQSIPPLFHEIIKNQARRAAIKAAAVADLLEYRQLQREMQDFRQAAMKLLKRG